MEFQTRDQDEIRKLLEGHESVLAKTIEEDEAYYASKICPSCGAPTYQVPDARQPFIPGRLTPRCLLHCTQCKTLFEPDTGIILESGESYEPMPTVADIFIPNE